MHLDYTIHFWLMVGYLASLGAAIRFLVFLGKQITRAVNAIVETKTAFVTMIQEHHEVYGWYSEHVKPNHKRNGAALAAPLERS